MPRMRVCAFMFRVILCCFAYNFLCFALVSLANGIWIIKNTCKDKELGRFKKTKQYIWAVLMFGYVAVIVWFQLYDFVHI